MVCKSNFGRAHGTFGPVLTLIFLLSLSSSLFCLLVCPLDIVAPRCSSVLRLLR